MSALVKAPLESPADVTYLVATVGNKGRNRRPDVARIETLLCTLGYLTFDNKRGRPTAQMDGRIVNAIRQFQQDAGLPVDGVVHPVGVTLQELSRRGAAGARLRWKRFNR